MSGQNDPNDRGRRKPQSPFTQSEQRDRLVKLELEKERAAVDAKTAKLRALRLAKEEAERLAAESAPKPDAAAKKPRRKAKP